MAKSLWDRIPHVGQCCYRPYDILKPGKIVSVAQLEANGSYDVYIKWLDGSYSTENTLYLNDFDHATDEHLKKYNKFDALRIKLKSL